MSEFDDAKERIRARVDLAQLVGETVALKPAGRGQLKGLCPFHSERTPSFHVHVERGFFYCFGCGAKGDVFDYVMRTQGIEFRDALQFLGERVGAEVRGPPAGQGRRRDLLEIHDAALAWFTGQLPGSPAADYLRRRGHRPGIASRGYGGSAAARATRVTADADPAWVGDEPLLLVRRCRCPVVVGRDRVAAARRLVDEMGCDLVISDDGLQHYRLRRDLEILVVDAVRRFGNGRCLPAGPLREPVARARRVDLVILNGEDGDDGPRMRLRPGPAVSLAKPELTRALLDFRGSRVTAVAGIGHPQRFFAMLRGLGLDIDARPYPDHHRFSAADVAAWPPGPVLMTEKDAVKCIGLTGADAWYVPVDARPDAGFVTALAGHLGMIQSLVRA